MIKWNVIDQQCEQLLIELVGELIFVAAPFRGDPILGHQEQNRLAARGGIFQRSCPSFAGDEAVVRVEIEKYVVGSAPTFADQPVAQCYRPVVVPARMTDEQA